MTMDTEAITAALRKAFPGCDIKIHGHPNVNIHVQDAADPNSAVTTVYHANASAHATPEFVVKHLLAIASPALLDKRRKARIWEALKGCAA